MVNILSKSLEQISSDDIESLISDEVPEGIHIEFKARLPAKDGKLDSWCIGKNKIGDRARNKILEETVAFANAFGGCLLLGIGESRSNPPVADKIHPIQRCADLAERLKLIFRDCVEPELHNLEIFAIPMEGDKGVVILRTDRSSYAPHRVKTTRVCSIRRSNRCEPMSMKEIQDMTLTLSGISERLKEKLSERSACFEKEFQNLADPQDAFGLRVTAAPIRDEIKFDKVYDQGGIVEKLWLPFVRIQRKVGDNTLPLISFQSGHNLFPSDWRPRLRATRADAYYFADKGNWRHLYHEVHCDGLLEIGFLSTLRIVHPIFNDAEEMYINIDKPVSMFAHVVEWADRIRIQAKNPMVGFVVEIEIKVKGGEVPVTYNDFGFSFRLGDLPIQSKIFPHYNLTESAKKIDLVAQFERDFWNFLEREIGDRQGSLEFH